MVQKFDYRVCFVCGQGFDKDDIAKHETNCLNGWMRECDRLERRFEARTPEPLEIPSIDGTKDLRRLNDHAKDQAARAQLLRCRKCNEKVPFRKADDHRCTRFDPPIEFFF
ncbi:hypothetical protein OESDEN_01367 [Oesophagostomum dentatum]|uniref:Zinc finger, C2H2 type n=1 Tax=Oesophagostomum dentatum TaxID=61180 RepID=A0A0B1TRF9_OESDE|nr:hypothetical protein OESDEN_01367 [Oesophagostomum dentatum]